MGDNSGLERTIGAIPHTTSPEIPVHKGKHTFFEQVKEAHLQVTISSNVFEGELPYRSNHGQWKKLDATGGGPPVNARNYSNSPVSLENVSIKRPPYPNSANMVWPLLIISGQLA